MMRSYDVGSFAAALMVGNRPAVASIPERKKPRDPALLFSVISSLSQMSDRAMASPTFLVVPVLE